MTSQSPSPFIHCYRSPIRAFAVGSIIFFSPEAEAELLAIGQFFLDLGGVGIVDLDTYLEWAMEQGRGPDQVMKAFSDLHRFLIIDKFRGQIQPRNPLINMFETG